MCRKKRGRKVQSMSLCAVQSVSALGKYKFCIGVPGSRSISLFCSNSTLSIHFLFKCDTMHHCNRQILLFVNIRSENMFDLITQFGEFQYFVSKKLRLRWDFWLKGCTMPCPFNNWVGSNIIIDPRGTKASLKSEHMEQVLHLEQFFFFFYS